MSRRQAIYRLSTGQRGKQTKQTAPESEVIADREVGASGSAVFSTSGSSDTAPVTFAKSGSKRKATGEVFPSAPAADELQKRLFKSQIAPAEPSDGAEVITLGSDGESTVPADCEVWNSKRKATLQKIVNFAKPVGRRDWILVAKTLGGAVSVQQCMEQAAAMNLVQAPSKAAADQALQSLRELEAIPREQRATNKFRAQRQATEAALRKAYVQAEKDSLFERSESSMEDDMRSALSTDPPSLIAGAAPSRRSYIPAPVLEAPRSTDSSDWGH